MPTDPKFLKSFPCFSNLSEEQLESLAEITNAVCYPPGQLLFEEGKPGECLFFLIKGDVEVLYQIGEAGSVHVDTISGEEFVGCSALVEPYVYTASERCLTEVEVLEIGEVALRELMKKDCQLGLNLQSYIIKILMGRILKLRVEATL